MPNGDVCLAAPTSLSPVGCACGGVPAKIIEGMVATSSAAPLLPLTPSLSLYPLSAVNGIRETVIGCLFAGRALSRDAKLPVPDTEK